MMLRKYIILIAMLLASVGLRAGASGLAGGRPAEVVVGRTAEDRPQWEDLGMSSLLVVAQPSVEAPSSLRLGGNPVATGCMPSKCRQCNICGARCWKSVCRPSSAAYLHMIVCLRL